MQSLFKCESVVLVQEPAKVSAARSQRTKLKVTSVRALEYLILRPLLLLPFFLGGFAVAVAGRFKFEGNMVITLMKSE